jgi:hypothetical protein
MSDTDTLWAAKLHLSSGKPATLLGTDTISDICEAYVAIHERNFRYAQELCRQEVLKEREACAKIADEQASDAPDDSWSSASTTIAEDIRARSR